MNELTDEQLSQLNDADLQALAAGNLDALSDAGLQVVAGAPKELSLREKASQVLSGAVKAKASFDNGMALGATLDYLDTTKLPNVGEENAAAVKEWPTLNQAGKFGGALATSVIPGSMISRLMKIPQIAKSGALGRMLLESGGGAVMEGARKPRRGETRGGNAARGAAYAGLGSGLMEGTAAMSNAMRSGAQGLGRSLTRMTPDEARAYVDSPDQAEKLATLRRDSPEQIESDLERMIRGERVPGGYEGGASAKIKKNVGDPNREAKLKALSGKSVRVNPGDFSGTSVESRLKSMINPEQTVQRPLLQKEYFDVPVTQPGLPLEVVNRSERFMPTNETQFVETLRQGNLGLEGRVLKERLASLPKGQLELPLKAPKQLSLSFDELSKQPKEGIKKYITPGESGNINWETQYGLPMKQVTEERLPVTSSIEFPNAQVQDPLPLMKDTQIPGPSRMRPDGTVELTLEELDELMQDLGKAFKAPLDANAPASVIARREADATRYEAVRKQMETEAPSTVANNLAMSKSLRHQRIADKKGGSYITRYLDPTKAAGKQIHRNYVEKNAGIPLKKMQNQMTAGEKVLPPADGKEGSLLMEILQLPTSLSGLSRTRPKKLMRTTGRSSLRTASRLKDSKLKEMLQNVQGQAALSAILNEAGDDE
jgi:hypothetical protein